jgi:hypothetical protein
MRAEVMHSPRNEVTWVPTPARQRINRKIAPGEKFADEPIDSLPCERLIIADDPKRAER